MDIAVYRCKNRAAASNNESQSLNESTKVGQIRVRSEFVEVVFGFFVEQNGLVGFWVEK